MRLMKHWDYPPDKYPYHLIKPKLYRFYRAYKNIRSQWIREYYSSMYDTPYKRLYKWSELGYFERNEKYHVPEYQHNDTCDCPYYYGTNYGEDMECTKCKHPIPF